MIGFESAKMRFIDHQDMLLMRVCCMLGYGMVPSTGKRWRIYRNVVCICRVAIFTCCATQDRLEPGLLSNCNEVARNEGYSSDGITRKYSRFCLRGLCWCM